MQSYAGTMEFGITACRRVLSQAEAHELIELLRAGLKEIEALEPVAVAVDAIEAPPRRAAESKPVKAARAPARKVRTAAKPVAKPASKTIAKPAAKPRPRQRAASV